MKETRAREPRIKAFKIDYIGRIRGSMGGICRGWEKTDGSFCYSGFFCEKWGNTVSIIEPSCQEWKLNI